MALYAKKLRYYRNGVEYITNLYTTAAEVGTEYISFRDGTTTVYARLGDTTNSEASHLRVQKGGATRAVIKSAAGWRPMNNGMDSTVNALLEFGGLIHAGGAFMRSDGIMTNSFAQWNGSGWSTGGAEAFNLTINALCNHNGYIHVGSTSVGQLNANGSWSYLGNLGTNKIVRTLLSFGGELYAGGVSVGSVAKWNGANWSGVGDGLGGEVYALLVSGGSLYAGAHLSQRAAGLL